MPLALASHEIHTTALLKPAGVGHETNGTSIKVKECK